MHLSVLYNAGKFQSPSSNTFRDMNYFLVIFGQVQTTDCRQTESDAYELTVKVHKWAQKFVMHVQNLA